jgi:hypothetical protein
MSRRSQIEVHPQREAIERAMQEGVPGVEISRRYGVSESAISRYQKLHSKDALAQVADPYEHDPSSVMTRLVDLADSARRARLAADITGTPLTRARAQAAELAVLEKLSERLGIDSLTPVYMSQGASSLVTVVQNIVTENPNLRTRVLSLLREHEPLIDLADALAASTPRGVTP